MALSVKLKKRQLSTFTFETGLAFEKSKPKSAFLIVTQLRLQATFFPKN